MIKGKKKIYRGALLLFRNGFSCIPAKRIQFPPARRHNYCPVQVPGPDCSYFIINLLSVMQDLYDCMKEMHLHSPLLPLQVCRMVQTLPLPGS